jgi:hypothetical protein
VLEILIISVGITFRSVLATAFAKSVNDGGDEIEGRNEVANEAKSNGHLGIEDVLSHRCILYQGFCHWFRIREDAMTADARV